MNFCKFDINDFVLGRKVKLSWTCMFRKARHKVTNLNYLIYQKNVDYFYNDIICNILISGSFVQPVLGYDVELSEDGSIKTYYLFFSEPKCTLEEFFDKEKFDGDYRLYNTTRMKIILGIAKFLDLTGKLNVSNSFYSLTSVQINDCMEPIVFANSSDHFFLLGDDPIELRQDVYRPPFLNLLISPQNDDECPLSKNNVFTFGSFLYFLFISHKIVEKEYHIIFKYYSLIRKGGRLNNINDAVPDCFWKMIELCWAPNPDDRPSFDELISTLLNQEEFHKDVDMEEVRKYYEKLESSLQRTNDFIKDPQLCSYYRRTIKSNFSEDNGSEKHIYYNSIKNNPMFIFNIGSNQIGNQRENEELKKEIEELKREIEELKIENEELKKENMK